MTAMMIEARPERGVVISEFTQLSALLAELVRHDLGVVLDEGGPAADQRGRSGIVRVSGGSVAIEERLVEVYREHYHSLVGFAMRTIPDKATAEDVVQTAFMKVYRARPTLRDPAALGGYVQTAVRNETMRQLRTVIVDRENRQGDPDSDRLAAIAAGGRPVDDRVALLMDLRRALTRLSQREREAVVLRKVWQLSEIETAETMGISKGAVKSYCWNGLNKLTTIMGGRL
jgi:RNA polymerase sigma factor (sigma-70 family)